MSCQDESEIQSNTKSVDLLLNADMKEHANYIANKIKMKMTVWMMWEVTSTQTCVCYCATSCSVDRSSVLLMCSILLSAACGAS